MSYAVATCLFSQKASLGADWVREEVCDNESRGTFFVNAISFLNFVPFTNTSISYQPGFKANTLLKTSLSISFSHFLSSTLDCDAHLTWASCLWLPDHSAVPFSYIVPPYRASSSSLSITLLTLMTAALNSHREPSLGLNLSQNQNSQCVNLCCDQITWHQLPQMSFTLVCVSEWSGFPLCPPTKITFAAQSWKHEWQLSPSILFPHHQIQCSPWHSF